MHFYLRMRTSSVQEMTYCGPSTITKRLRSDCGAAIPAARRALEMWLGKENCGDGMGGGARWVRFLLLNHWDLFRKEMAIDKVVLQCIIEACDS